MKALFAAMLWSFLTVFTIVSVIRFYAFYLNFTISEDFTTYFFTGSWIGFIIFTFILVALHDTNSINLLKHLENDEKSKL